MSQTTQRGEGRLTGSRAQVDGAVLIVMPTYREAANITASLEAVRSSPDAPEVLVVDDEGGDGTAELVERAAQRLGGTSLLRRPRKAGLASAYREGFEWGIARGYDVLVGMDADLSHDATALPRLLAAVHEGADVAIGSRYIAGGSTVDWSLGRRVLSHLGNLYARALLGVGPADLTSAFRAYRSSALGMVELGELRSEGYGFLIELAYRLERAGAVMVEVPIRFANRVHGRSKMAPSIAVEALVNVTRLGVAERRRRSSRTLVRRADRPY